MLADMLTTGLAGNELRRVARGGLASALDAYDPRDVVREQLVHAPPREVGLVNSMRYLDTKLTLAGDILVKVDRASMAVSLEVRPVFLHRDVLALAARIPPGRLATWRESKRLLKDAVRPWLPARTIGRPKMGFAMPLKNWLGRLDAVLRPADRGGLADEWLDGELTERIIADRAAGPGSHAALVHSLAFLRQWSARWVEDGATAEYTVPAARSAAPVWGTQTC